MTKARPRFTSGKFLAQEMSSASTVVRMGDWIYTSSPASGVHATHHDNVQRIQLRYSDKLLKDLLAELGRIEAELVSTRRTPEGCGGPRESWRSTSRV
jgi:hypothetical protein